MLVFPEDFRLTGALAMPQGFDGELVKGRPSELITDLMVGPSRLAHVFHPISWLLRNTAKPREFLQLDDKADPPDPFETDKSTGTNLLGLN
jgi:hypothetical protein